MPTKLFKVPMRGGFYAPDMGSFGVLCKDTDYRRTTVEWTHCREVFEAEFETKPFNRFLIRIDRKEAGRVARFLRAVQDQVGLPSGHRVRLERTNTKGVYLVVLGPFWRNEVRLSLLTCLLRAGRKYTKRYGFWEAMEDDKYLSETEDAVAWFLMGNTEYKPKGFFGWHTTFYEMSLRELSKTLTDPKAKRRRAKV